MAMTMVGPFVRENIGSAGGVMCMGGQTNVAAGVVMPSAGTVMGVSVNLSAPLAAGTTYSAQAVVGGAPTLIVAEVSNGGSSGYMTNSGVAVKAGDVVTVQDGAGGGAMGRASAVVVWVSL